MLCKLQYDRMNNNNKIMCLKKDYTFFWRLVYHWNHINKLCILNIDNINIDNFNPYLWIWWDVAPRTWSPWQPSADWHQWRHHTDSFLNQRWIRSVGYQHCLPIQVINLHAISIICLYICLISRECFWKKKIS